MDVKFLRLAREESRDRNILMEISMMFFVFVIGSLVSEVFSNFLFNIIAIKELIFLYSGIGIILVTLGYCKFIEGRSFESMGFRKNTVVLDYVKGLMVGLFLLAGVYIILLLLGNIQFIGLNKDIDYGILFLLFLGFVIQGMGEEVLCRGYIMVSLGRRFGLVAGVILNSLIFSLLHLFNDSISYISLFNIFVVGIFFSLYMIYTENIWGVGAVHTMWNFAQGNIFGIPVSGIDVGESLIKSRMVGNSIVSGGPFGIEGSIVTSVLFTVLTFILIYKIGKKTGAEDKGI